MNSKISKKLLYADADESQKIEITESFEREGYEVYFVHQGDMVISKTKEINPNVIVLDVLLPNIDGIELCIELRKIENFKNIPIVFVSSQIEDFTQIAALDSGADGYLAKPTRPRLIMSHINSILRRAQNNIPKNIEDTKSLLAIDEEKLCAIVDGAFVPLALKEFAILRFLLSKPGRVFTRKEIFEKNWSDDSKTNERTIDVHIRKLRKKIGGHFVSTFKGVGYKVDLN
jgi:two-component system, OmpR family, alkaline phosphatase synthesis response regulator PhoP